MADEYISKQRAKDLMGCCLASAKAEYKAAKDEFTKARFGDYISSIQSMIDVVGSVEAVDVQPIRHGRWTHDMYTQWKCSECGNFLDFDGLNCGRGTAFYCPNCGARMDGEQQ